MSFFLRLDEMRKLRYSNRKMPLKQRLTDEDRDEITKDVDDLDANYINQMKDAGIDEDLLQQFRDLTIELGKERGEQK